MNQKPHHKANRSWNVTYKSNRGELTFGEASLNFRQLGAAKDRLVIPLTNIKGSRPRDFLEVRNAEKSKGIYILRVDLHTGDERGKLKRKLTCSIDDFGFEGEYCREQSDKARVCLEEGIKFFTLTEKSRVRINFLEEYDEFLRAYQRLVISQTLTENEFWSLLEFFKEYPASLLQDFEMTEGLSNCLVKYDPKTAMNKELNFSVEDLALLYRIYPEFKEKSKEDSTERVREGQAKKDKRVQFIEDQVKKDTELVGSHRDIYIEEMYKSKAPVVALSPHVKAIFKHSFYPAFSLNTGKGLYKTRIETEISSTAFYMEENKKVSMREKEEDEKVNGMPLRLNRHSKRLLCSMGTDKEPPMKPTQQTNFSAHSGTAPQCAVTPRADTDGSKQCLAKLLKATQGMKEKNTLQPYIIKTAVAEDAWKYLSSEAAIGNFILFSERNPTSKQKLASNLFREAQFLLIIFYKQIPMTRQRHKDVLDRLESLMLACMRKIKVLLDAP
eukprot:TRINITY_DN3921_c0_g7_i4.p1 TRINITY_DN3921_c0_g7~~TRINITY_DN3921_c0_g7_i4.p1  ORF type:complete len:499 (-),score=133.72 TRINITY_DN3921_c0_g7_i4:155-1651(-)